MHVRCTECSARFRVDDQYGGRWGLCSQCAARFLLPIPDANRLLEWASTTHWSKLLRFVRKGRARGHSPETIKKFIRVYELRKWAEEDRVRPEGGWGHTRAASSPGQSNLDAPENPALAYDSLDELRRLDPYEFERFIADVFDQMGYDATAIGGTADGGIDVEIHRRDGRSTGDVYLAHFGHQP